MFTCTREPKAAEGFDPGLMRTRTALGPGIGSSCTLRAATEKSLVATRAPLPISRSSGPPLPIEGIVAVATITSRCRR